MHKASGIIYILIVIAFKREKKQRLKCQSHVVNFHKNIISFPNIYVRAWKVFNANEKFGKYNVELMNEDLN